MGEVLSTIVWIIVIVVFLIRRLQKQKALDSPKAPATSPRAGPRQGTRQGARPQASPPPGIKFFGDLRETLDGLLAELNEAHEAPSAKPARPVPARDRTAEPLRARRTRLEKMAAGKETSIIEAKSEDRPETRPTYSPPKPAAQPAAPAPRPNRFALAAQDTGKVRDGFIWSEILGPPLSLRNDR
jgi:hypothetical protein